MDGLWIVADPEHPAGTPDATRPAPLRGAGLGPQGQVALCVLSITGVRSSPRFFSEPVDDVEPVRLESAGHPRRADRDLLDQCPEYGALLAHV